MLHSTGSLRRHVAARNGTPRDAGTVPAAGGSCVHRQPGGGASALGAAPSRRRARTLARSSTITRSKRSVAQRQRFGGVLVRQKLSRKTFAVPVWSQKRSGSLRRMRLPFTTLPVAGVPPSITATPPAARVSPVATLPVIRLPTTVLPVAPNSPTPAPDSAGNSALAGQALVLRRMWLGAIRKSPAAPGDAATTTPTQLSWTELATILPCWASLMRMPNRLSCASLANNVA